MLLLLYPPITKACEPPAGLPLLSAAVKAHGKASRVMDLNLGAQEFFLDRYFKSHPRKARYRDLIRDSQTYRNSSRYDRTVQELNRGLQFFQEPGGILGLANYSHPVLDSLSSADLLKAAAEYQENLFFPYYRKVLQKLLERRDIDSIGISLQFIHQAIPVMGLLGYLKDQFPHIPVILGGGLVTSWSRLDNWKDPFDKLVDRTVAGPGEDALLQWLGLRPDKEKLTSFLPDYSDLDLDRYYSPGRILPLAGSTGCFWKKCRFCPEQSEDNPYKARPASQIIKQMDRLEQQWKPRLFHFMDNEISPALMKALSERRGGIPWYGFTKFYPVLKDRKFCRKLKASGCAMLKLGLESGDQKVLDDVDKGFLLEDASLILENLKEAGIPLFIYILLGTPAEDHESARKTLNFLSEYHESISCLNTAVFNLPIHNREYHLEGEFRYSKADLTLYRGFSHPLGWDRPAIRKFLKEELGKESSLREILASTPRFFTSNHAGLVSLLKQEKDS